MSAQRDSRAPETPGRRGEERIEVEWKVDCESADTFLYARITNVSSLGLFVRTEAPLPIGTRVRLSFSPDEGPPFELEGEVAWINPVRLGRENLNPGMGVRFVHLAGDDRERLVDAIHTIAYVRDDGTN